MDYDGLPKWQQKLYAGVVMVGFVLILIGVGYVFYYDNQLKKNHRITKGVVFERKIQKWTKSYILCRFQVGSEVFENFTQTNYFERDNNCTFEVGDSVIIYYYTPDPGKSKVDLDSSYSRWKKKDKDN